MRVSLILDAAPPATHGRPVTNRGEWVRLESMLCSRDLFETVKVIVVIVQATIV